MNHKCVAGFPIGFQIKWMGPAGRPHELGNCYDRSMYMFLCFDDALLVRAQVADIAMHSGWEKAGHGWMERGNYVYDPTRLARFNRDLYYEIQQPRYLTKIDRPAWEERMASMKRELHEKLFSPPPQLSPAT